VTGAANADMSEVNLLGSLTLSRCPDEGKGQQGEGR
jgi:hypothetical protein